MYTEAEFLLKEENVALKIENQRLRSENQDLVRHISNLKTELRSLKAKLDEPTANMVVNELPKEILWLVFQRVIPPIGLLDTSLSAGPDSPWARTLEIKKNLTLVSRAWYDIGTCFLYRNVTIRRFPQVVSLLRTLEGPSGEDLRKLIKSLELNCYIPGGSIAVDFGRCLRTLFNLCPSLKRFSYSSQCALPPAIFRYDEPFPTAITELSLDKTVDSATVQRILAHVRNNLRYLRMGIPIADWPSPYEPDQPSSTFPFLHTLWLEICGWRQGPEINAMETWKLPSLNHLIVRRFGQVTSSYGAGDGSTLSANAAKDYILSFLMRCGGTIKDLCLHKPHYDGDTLQQLLDRCPLLERLTVHFAPPLGNDAAAYRLGPHSSLRCIDFLIESPDKHSDVYIEVEGIPSFLGYREFLGLPPFTYHWLHHFDVPTETQLDDSFEVNLFQHRLVKCATRIFWNVVASTPRLQDLEDESCMSEASSDEVLYDVQSSANDAVLDDLLSAETPEGSTFSDASEVSGRDVLMSDGSVTDLVDDDVVGPELDAECDIFDSCSKERPLVA